MPRHLHPLLILPAVLLLFAAAGQARAGDGLTEERARELHTLLAPPADEAWRSIPWRTSVIDAQRVAIEQGKPIFIWAMDGHPLGCV